MSERTNKPTIESAVTLLNGNESKSIPVRPQSKLKQHAGAWVSAVLSLLLLILTIAYACRCLGVSQYQSIASSRSRTILVLRVLSELTTTLLGLTLALTIERVQWHQIVRERGQLFGACTGHQHLWSCEIAVCKRTVYGILAVVERVSTNPPGHSAYSKCCYIR